MSTVANANVSISWNAPKGQQSPVSYRLSRANTNNVFAVIANTQRKTFTDSVVSSNTYFYEVTALSSGQESFPSNVLSITIPFIAPPVVQNVFFVTAAGGQQGSMPFEGSWESSGEGYSAYVNSPTGTITPSNTFNGNMIAAVGVVTGTGYAANGVSSPVFFVVMPPGVAQNFFTSVTVTKPGACSSFTFLTSAAQLYSQNPVNGASPTTNWVWTVADATQLFVDGVTTNVTFFV